jgi:hypothetical protein
MAGGNSGGVESYLPIAAALAATIATDGAASPWLVETMGATAAGALTSGAAAAAASGLTAAVTGQDVGRSALTGAVSGGIGGALSGYGAAADAANAGTTGATTTAPLTGSNVAGNAAFSPEAYFNGASSGTFVPSAGYSAALPGAAGAEIGVTGDMARSAATGGAQVDVNGLPINSGPAPAPLPGSSGIGNWLANNKGIAALGGTAALGYLMQSGNNKYGTPATQTYDGPLSQFHYDRTKYTPLTTAQPSPAYTPQYANYVKTPYNAYAAEGGRVVAMAEGGIAMANQSIGPVEQMSRDNAVGNNQMFPQANISNPAFSSATNTPMGTNMIASTSDTDVDPYTGAQRFAEGGTAEAPQTPAAIPLQAMPNFITQNSVNTNNALTQDLVSRLAARNAANPVPGQTPPVAPMQPAGIMAAAPMQQYQGYSAPTFTRPTNVAPIQFQNPGAILGTKAYNDRLAAEAEAARQAELAAQSNTFSGDGGYTAGAAGGLMNSYAAGGGVGHLGGYAAGGNPHLLKGPGDGMSDNIPATIGGKQPARLADGEFVVPADVVSHLGNGSTDAGAKHLYAMMDKVRKARTGNKKQGKQIKADKYLKV